VVEVVRLWASLWSTGDAEEFQMKGIRRFIFSVLTRHSLRMVLDVGPEILSLHDQ